MYVYHNYYEASQVALIYPGNKSFNNGFYLDPKTGLKTSIECSVITLEVIQRVYDWQKHIHNYIFDKLNQHSLTT